MAYDIKKEDWDARVDSVERVFEEEREETRRTIAKNVSDEHRPAILSAFDAGYDEMTKRVLAALRGK